MKTSNMLIHPCPPLMRIMPLCGFPPGPSMKLSIAPGELPRVCTITIEYHQCSVTTQRNLYNIVYQYLGTSKISIIGKDFMPVHRHRRYQWQPQLKFRCFFQSYPFSLSCRLSVIVRRESCCHGRCCRRVIGLERQASKSKQQSTNQMQPQNKAKQTIKVNKPALIWSAKNFALQPCWWVFVQL